MDLLFKSKTVIGAVIVFLAWFLGPESEPLKVLPQSLVDMAYTLGGTLGVVGLRDALRQIK